MSGVMNVVLPRRMMVLAGLTVLLCTVTGCTPIQQQDLSTFAEDFLRNLITALVL